MTMREKIARAIAAQKMGSSNNGERLPDDLWIQALPIADAVLDAMLGPTPEMVEAGKFSAEWFYGPDAIFKAMIGAAKGETE